jgi:hypothetical protein
MVAAYPFVSRVLFVPAAFPGWRSANKKRRIDKRPVSGAGMSNGGVASSDPSSGHEYVERFALTSVGLRSVHLYPRSVPSFIAASFADNSATYSEAPKMEASAKCNAIVQGENSHAQDRGSAQPSSPSGSR